VRLEVDLEACTSLGIEIVRRFTGGGAVYQDPGNINYSLSIRKDSVNDIVCQSEFNALLLHGVVKALSSLGISAASDSGRGVWVRGRKVCGIAGFTSRSSYFGHGTLLVNSRLQLIRKVLAQTDTKDGGGPVRSTLSRVTNLNALVSSRVSMDAVKSALISGFEEVFESRFVKGKLRAGEMRLAERLYEEKYLQGVCSPLCPASKCLSRAICPYAE
jgi:lipoate-protein ligase A